MITIFSGQDSFRIAGAVKKITEQKEASGYELNFVGGDSLADFINNLLSSSFFNEKRLFVVSDILGTIDKDQEALLISSFEKMDNKTDVIIIEPNALKKSAVLDYVKKNGESKVFEAPKNIDVGEYIRKRVKEEGSSIAPLAVERLVSAVGDDLWQAEEEIIKLVLYKRGSEDPIQTSDVELLVHFQFNENIFSLLDAIAGRNHKRAISLINDFLDAGENAIYILTMIEWHFRNIAMAKFEEGISEFALSKKAKLNPYVAKKAVSLARSFTKLEILNIYQKMRWADLQLKSGGEPKQILTRLIV